MMHPHWQSLKRHPLSAEYDDIKDIDPEAWAKTVDDVLNHGNVTGRKIFLYQGKIIDGFQFFQAHVAAGKTPEFEELVLPPDLSAEEWVKIVNDNRRHETEASRTRKADRRRKRIADMRAAGQSTRAIAETVGVSQKTVMRDIEALTESGDSVQPESGKVKSKDGIERPAKEPPIIAEIQARISAGGISPRLVPLIVQLSKEQQHRMESFLKVGKNPKDAMDAAQEPDAVPTRNGKAPKTGGHTPPKHTGTGLPLSRPEFDMHRFSELTAQLKIELDKLLKQYAIVQKPHEYNGLARKIAEVKKEAMVWSTQLRKKGAKK